MKGFKLQGKDRDLPDLPSAGILACLEDLEMCEKSDKYTVDMHNWHHPENNKCRVCLGGSRLARLADDSKQFIEPYERFCLEKENKNKNKIIAMDCFRRGDVIIGVEYYLTKKTSAREHDKLEKIEDGIDVSPYSVYPDKFKKDIRNLAEELKAVGY